MRATRAEQFTGYEALKLVELPKPTVTDGKVLLRITAAGVTPLDHTIRFGIFPSRRCRLSWATRERAWWRREAEQIFPSEHVMSWGAYGAFENGTYCEWVGVRKEDLCLLPDSIDDVSAACMPVAHLTGQVALTLPGQWYDFCTIRFEQAV